MTTLDPALLGAGLTALVVIMMFAGFATEWRSPEITAGLGVSILMVAGVLSVDEMLAVLSSTAITTIGAMFVISAGLVRTGAVDRFAEFATGHARKSPGMAFLVFLFAAAAMSAIMNNTPLVMLLIPVAARIARETGQSSSKFLIPLSYAAILGGTCTLIGTSTNLLVDSVAQKAGLEPFSVFEIAPVGIAATIVGIVALYFSSGLLPERAAVTSLDSNQTGRRFILQAVIEEGSSHVGVRAKEVAAFNQPNRRIIDVLRGDLSLRRDLDDVILQPGDTVVLRSSVAEILSMKEEGALAAPSDRRIQQTGSRTSVIYEILIGPGARILNRTLRHLRLRRRYGIYPIALHRGGLNMADRFETTPLAVGDTLLIEGAPEDLARFAEENSLVNVSEPAERGYRRYQAPLAISVALAVVMGAAIGIMPIAGLAMIGAVVMLATRCVEVDEAVQSVDWRILGLIAAMLGIGAAMDKTGLVEAIVGFFSPSLGSLPPLAALAAVYLLATVLTELVTNNAVAVIVTPVAIVLAQSLGLDPRPFVVAVMIAASASFMTPIGYQTNTLVYNAGGYRFTDFLRVGFIADLTTFAAAMLIIPIFWPLVPVSG